MSPKEKLVELFLEFHSVESSSSSREIDWSCWAERAFEAVMGKEPDTDVERCYDRGKRGVEETR